MAIPFVTDSYRDINPPINWYPAADQDKGVVLFASEGLDALVTPVADNQIRAFRDMGSYLYVMCGSAVYKIDSLYNTTLLGSVGNNLGAAWIEQNGTQIAFCDGANLYVYTPSTSTFAKVTDADFPGASCLTYQDGYGAFINPGTNQFYLTASYDFTDIDALDYASAEGWPDNISSIIMEYRELWLIGSESVEFWENTGGTFPFSRIGGHGMIHQGISAPATVRKFNNGLVWLNHNREVVWFQGYQPKVISIPKMTREIESYAAVSDATSFDYTIRGHAFYGLNFPSGNATWVYDALTQTWHKRQSYQDGTDELGRWRGNCTYYWNSTQLVGDYANGKIYKMSPDYYDEDGEEIVRTLDSQEMRNGGNPIFFPGMQILFSHGTAASGITPQAMLQWSNDGGKTWSNEYWRNAGLIGEYKKRCRWLRLGMAREHRIFRLVVSDAVPWDILDVNMVNM